MTRAPQLPSAKDRERQEEHRRFGTRDVGEPQVGFYRMRAVKGGRFVGARIYIDVIDDPDFPENEMDRSPMWHGEINGVVDPDPSPAPTEAVWRIHEHGERVDEAEFLFLRADADWQREHTDDEPERPIDWLTIKPPF
jgi:hypothetical protein